MAESSEARRSTSLRVLVVEDSEDDVALVVAELRRGGFDVTWQQVDTASALLAQLAARPWDLVISDHNLPQFCAPEALQIVRERAADLPFIIVSGSIGEAQAVAVMRAGANDYLLKGQLARLTPAVERELADASQRRRREQAEHALRRTEEQLLQAQKMEAIGRLAGGIAHDFNNLLTAILGYSELVLSTMPPDAAERADIEEIWNAGQRAGGLTQQLLAFSRQQVLDARVVQVNDIIANVEKLLRRIIGEDVELCVDLDTATEPVKVDPGQIEQVLMNLAVNARDAMPTGGRLVVRSRLQNLAEPLLIQDVTLTPGRYAYVTVSDSGTGMSPEIAARIFEPFFTTKGPGKGTGLGLSTVYGIVRQSGGAISVASEPGRGTEFGVYLPCADAPLEEDRPSAEPPRSVQGSESVLVVDDESGIRTLVHRVLEPLGYDVHSVGDGLEALDFFAEHRGPINLLITDVVMPRMGGRQLVKCLAERRRCLPVLFLSGYPDAAHDDATAPNSVSASLMKPFTPAALTRKVRDLLNGSPVRSDDVRTE
jgi:two-component system, cell cycle sensor histidine kinase and response regulator CckA